MTKAERIGLCAFALVAGLSIECGTTPCNDASCADATTVPPVSGGGCDSNKPPSQGGCAVDDSDGFFVSPAGSDSAPGTKVAPFLTVSRGIAAAAGYPSKPNVYVCHGTYAENLVIQNAPAGVALHGGFDCTSWAQVSAPTTVAPSYTPGDTNPQYVLHVLGAAALVESMTLTAPDATDPGMSSIAAFVDASPGMTFRRAAVTSGRGADAVTPTPPAPLAANSDGNPAPSTIQGAASKTCSCGADSTTGGQGGSPSGAASGGLPIISGSPDAGAAGQVGTCPGGNGANGLEGPSGASASSLGTLASSGWAPKAGAAGAGGGTAQGGGGAAYAIGGGMNAGGGGACGGCGGAGGAGGAGGGASIAIAAMNSTLRVQTSTIHAGTAGGGANGSAGQGGQPGGTGGASSPTFVNCNGGTGGTGGAGGAGGGGAGGVSIAIATVGTTPDVDTLSTVLMGTAGKGGHDGSPQALKAIDGVAQPLQAF